MSGQADDARKAWEVASKDDASLFRPGTQKNPVPRGFIFGNGSLGPGFYSEVTRDAYNILLVKMKEKAAYRQREVHYYDDDGMGCFSNCMPIKDNNKPERKTAVKQFEYATHLVGLVQARLDATGPFVPLSDSEIETHGGDPTSVGNSYTFQDLCKLSVTKKTKREKVYVSPFTIAALPRSSGV